MDTIQLWARNGDAVRQAIELGALVHLATTSEELTDAFVLFANELPRSKLRGIKPPLADSHGPASVAGRILMELVDGLHAHLRTTPTGHLGDAVAYSLFHCLAAAHIGE